jgi:predicted amidohydrolase YtcJ
LEAGLPLAFGSDFPIEPPDPLVGLWAAASRSEAQRLTRLETLAAYATGAARAVFEESDAGMLAPGRRADVSVFDLDLVDAPLEALRTARRVLTLVGGRVSP